MTSNHPTGRRPARRPLWQLLLVLAVIALVVSVAAATGLLGGSGEDAGRQPGAREPATSAPPASSDPKLPKPSKSATREARPMKESVPTRIRIPAIEVDSDLMDLGLQDDGTMETPPGAFPAGWYTGAPTPGELGPAIIVGHVRFNEPGVFERLTDLEPADRVDVRREDGSTATFRVTRLERFAKSQFPTQKVYGDIDHAGLRLITCAGLDASSGEFDENVVVFAELV